MSPEKRRVRKRSIVLATSGLALALFVGLVLRWVGVTSASYQVWLLAAGLTVVVQAVLWLIPHLGWDEKLGWDPHYIYMPMLAAAGLFTTYIYFVPATRVLLLMVWFVALLFVVGLAGMVEVVALSAVMAVGYLATAALSLARGGPGSLGMEVTVTLVFMIICVYSGVVFERLRRERLEMQALRRSLAELALTDPLTGLPNRRQFEETLRTELARTRRHGGPCSVVMIDVDHFKNYNDLLGHPAGDAALRQLAVVIRGHLRLGDVGARYGGEEFGLILTNTDKREASEAVERLRWVIETHPFVRRDVQPGGKLTISAGIATSPEDGDSYESLVQKADVALYLAKSAGRNHVEATA
jgi:diguanylate cyclase (GGDEF)-like protein